MKRRTRLVRGLPRRKLVREIHYHLRQGDASRRALAFYLLDLDERREYQALGYANTAQFADEELGISRKEAYELLRIARRLEELRTIDNAFARGRISWSKLREITRVATLETETEWLDFAKKKRMREIEAAVSRARRGERPPPGGLGTPRTTFRIQFTVSAELNEVFQVALLKLMGECGEEATPLDALKRMAELAIRTDPEGNVPGRGERERPIYTVVYHRTKSNDGGAAWVEGEEGRVPIPASVVEEAEREGRVIEVEEVQDPGEDGAIRFGERGSVAPEDRDRPVSESLRTAMLARDSHRCVVCGSRHALRAHHLASRANGGETAIENVLSLCVNCHSLVHEKLLFLRVDANGGLVATDRDGKPLRKSGGAAAVLEEDAGDCPLAIVERAAGEPAALSEAARPSEVEAPSTAAVPRDARAPSAPPAPPLTRRALLASVQTLEDLPAALTAREWKALGARLDWSPQRRVLVLRPDGVLDLSQNSPRGDKSEVEILREKDLGKQNVHQLHRLRPQELARFVGQRDAVEDLRLAAHSARRSGESLDHILLSSPPGLGKTTLARIVAREAGTRLHTAMGPAIEAPHQLVALLTGLEAGDVLFIDEIHRLTRSTEESLYSALEDGVVDVLVAQEGRTRTVRILLDDFTLIGATTELGQLSKPLRGRFALEERLEFYSVDELTEIVQRAAPGLSSPVDLAGEVSVSEGAARAIAERSRGVPREALRILRRARDHALAEDSVRIHTAHVEAAVARLGIDERGLWREERKVLDLLLTHGRPMGLETIAMTLRMDSDTLKHVHEPYLVEQGYVVRTPRGRMATVKARAARAS